MIAPLYQPDHVTDDHWPSMDDLRVDNLGTTARHWLDADATDNPSIIVNGICC